MCPIHHFCPSAACHYCAVFAGGFIGGFVNTPWKWVSGAQRIGAQGGLVLADPGKPEEAENKLIGQEIRAVSRLMVQPNIGTARAAWNLLPDGARTRLKESGFEALGGTLGSITATQVLMFGLSYLGGNQVARNQQFRPPRVIRGPAAIAATLILSTLSAQGNFAMLISRQRQIFNDYPGVEQEFRDLLDKLTK